MLKKVIISLVFLSLCFSSFSQSISEEEINLEQDIKNDLKLKKELEENNINRFDRSQYVLRYFKDRFSDLFEIVNVGVGFGKSVGFEVAITDQVQLGAYYASESGIGWMGRKNASYHKGDYYTWSIANYRYESDSNEQVRFYRNEWQVRIQAALFAHLYAAIDLKETADFIVGIFGYDLCDDDFTGTLGKDVRLKDYHPSDGSLPLAKLGRGLGNLLFGVLEIPKNMLNITKKENVLAGFTYGIVRGVGRGLTRILVGAEEIITSPWGGSPIINPVYVIGEGNDIYDDTWEYNW